MLFRAPSLHSSDGEGMGIVLVSLRSDDKDLFPLGRRGRERDGEAHILIPPRLVCLLAPISSLLHRLLLRILQSQASDLPLRRSGSSLGLEPRSDHDRCRQGSCGEFLPLSRKGWQGGFGLHFYEKRRDLGNFEKLIRTLGFRMVCRSSS